MTTVTGRLLLINLIGNAANVSTASVVSAYMNLANHVLVQSLALPTRRRDTII